MFRRGRWWWVGDPMRLGFDLAEPVAQTALEPLCDNLRPLTDGKLTAR